MNRKTMLFTMMMATAIVLLVGCHEGNRKGHSNELQTSASIDPSTLDEGYCERNPKYEVFHPDS